MRRIPAALALAAIIASGATLAAVRADETVSTAPHSDPDGWSAYGRDLTGQRYSPLQAIDPSNVGGLSLAWKKTLGPPVTMEGTPIVANGVEYVTTGKAALFALDAATGKTLWSYHYPLPPASYPRACCNIDNRGVTLIGDEVVLPTLDAHLVALDAKTGTVRWTARVAPNDEAYSITSPPVPVKGMVITGVGGGEYPTRGFLAAYDAKTGKQIWRTYTIPAPGEPGSETWGRPAGAQRGGGPTWLPGTYDAQRDTLYWGTGNPNPDWDPTFNSGDLLYTSSVIALDPNTGRIKWHYQMTPHNIWDYDATAVPMLVDVPVNGTDVAAVAQANRNGYLYVLNRDTGKLIYAMPYLDKITWGKVDRTTGTIAFNQDIQRAARAFKPYTVFPSVLGGTNWEPPAYDPAHHLMFIPALESSSVVIPMKAAPHPKAGALNFGGGFRDMKAAGSVTAVDLATGTIVWKHRFRSPNFGGALVTAGGLVFVGTLEGKLLGLDEKSGAIVWTGSTASGINAPPVTFAIDGQQYITVESGIGGVWSLYFLAGSTPYLTKVPPASTVYTWKLPTKTALRTDH